MKILEKGLAGLAVRRKRAGFTQQSFADALGIERARYANYEIGVAWPPARLLPGIASLLGCSIDDLYVPVAEETDCHTSAAAPVRNDRLAAEVDGDPSGAARQLPFAKGSQVAGGGVHRGDDGVECIIPDAEA